MAWLEGWSNRLEFTIDSDRVDEDLTDFPALITLSSGCGRNNFDGTGVFDELVETTSFLAEWNPDDKAAAIVILEDGLTVSGTAVSNWIAVRSKESKSSGKHYFEVTVLDIGVNNVMIGVGTSSETLTFPGDTTQGRGYYSLDGNKFRSSNVAYGNSYTTGDVIGVAIDLDIGKIWWSKNGVWQASGDPAAGTGAAYSDLAGQTWFAMVGRYNVPQKLIANFGATSFQYTIPEGFLPYNTDYVDNTKKIAVTDSTGTNQLPVEIEYWNWPDESAHLWTKVPTVTSGTDTILYLYYDSNQMDNDLWVGDTGTTPAKNVWDDDYKAVWHFNSVPLPLEDSTANLRHGTAGNVDSTNLVDATTWTFDGSSDYVGVPYHADLAPTDAITVEGVISIDAWDSGDQIFISKSQIGGYRLADDTGSYHPNAYGVMIRVGGDWRIVSTPSAVLEDGRPYYMAFSYDGQYLKLALNDSIVDTYNHGSVSPIQYSVNNSFIIAEEAGAGATPEGSNTAGDFKEVRVSDIARSEAWLKATNYTVFDNFMTFADGGTTPLFTCSGIVTVNNSPINDMPVRLYRRSTGELVGKTTTVSGGLFTIDSPYEEEHYILALYTSSDTNALIYDRIQP